MFDQPGGDSELLERWQHQNLADARPDKLRVRVVLVNGEVTCGGVPDLVVVVGILLVHDEEQPERIVLDPAEGIDEPERERLQPRVELEELLVGDVAHVHLEGACRRSRVDLELVHLGAERFERR